MGWGLIYPASWGKSQVQAVERADMEEIVLVVTCLSVERVVEQDNCPVHMVSLLMPS
jgi:hypothetical protein